MMKLKLFSLLVATALLPASLLGQAAATASVHGHVNNAAGVAITSGQVKLTTDKTSAPKDRKYKNVFEIDSNGDYKGTGIAPGDYIVIVGTGKVDSVDFQDTTFKAGEDKLMNFDMTRKEYIDKMTPEEKAALDDYKKHMGETLNANKTIANLNSMLKQVHDDMASSSPNYDHDVQLMQQATALKPDETVLWYNLGSTLTAAADAAVKQAKANKTSWQTDDTITKRYSDGIDAYKKGIELNAASKKPNPADAGIAWNSIGNAEAKLGKVPEAQEAFESAVKLAPANAGMVYGNEAAVLFNAGQGDAAGAAADKAIAADPTKADAYYIKGQTLIAKATVDKAGKIVAPPGCVDAYQKYLELLPNGDHAADVKEILASMGETVNTKYKAPKK
jgi:tetratricopeptide (TPR) repeat protein